MKVSEAIEVLKTLEDKGYGEEEVCDVREHTFIPITNLWCVKAENKDIDVDMSNEVSRVFYINKNLHIDKCGVEYVVNFIEDDYEYSKSVDNTKKNLLMIVEDTYRCQIKNAPVNPIWEKAIIEWVVK